MQHLEKIKIELVGDVRKEKISDEEYFSEAFADYASNSMLKLISPAEGGCPQKFFVKRPKIESTALEFGSAVHQLWLEPEIHEMQTVFKPSAKLGDVYKSYVVNRMNGMQIEESIILACLENEYYVKRLEKSRALIKEIINKCYVYHFAHKNQGQSKIPIYLSKPLMTKCHGCLNSLNSNERITKWVSVGDKYPEEAFFCDFKVSVPKNFSNLAEGYDEVIVPFKLKGDLVRIDEANGIFYLDDLKTSGKPIQGFMGQEIEEYFQKTFKPGSWQIFHYARQMGLYFNIIKTYLEQTYGKEFKGVASMIVVESNAPHFSNLFHVRPDDLKMGYAEGTDLLKRVGFHKLRGIDTVLEFENTEGFSFEI